MTVLPRRVLPAALLVAAHVSLAVTAAALQGPVIPGLYGKSGLDQTGEARLAIHELRCAACHQGVALGADAPPPAPDLSEVGHRVRPDYLRRFLADPHGTDPGTTMPDLLGALTEEERAQTVEGLVHFLVSIRGAEGAALEAPDSNQLAERGASLFHRVGCVACHGPRRSVYVDEADPKPEPGQLRLEAIATKYQPGELAAFLYEPHAARPAGRMPDMGLAKDEASALEAYLLRGPIDPGSDFTVNPERAAAGRASFAELRCANCHDVDGVEAADRSPLDRTVIHSGGCLSEAPAGAPNYAFSEGQRGAIAIALTSTDPAPAAELRTQHILTSLNCIACHNRGDYGGVSTTADPYFETSEPGLGDQARIPPSLTDTGAKLRKEWMRKVLFDGAAVRPYMETRMPQFKAAEMAELPELFAAHDGIEPFNMGFYNSEAKDEETRQLSRKLRDGGRELMGTGGVNCISCHNFNGRKSPNMAGMDLISTHERLQPDWFGQFLLNPTKMRPGIVMPASWPDGIAVHDGILDGDTRAQIEGIWTFLEQGRTARNPEGLLPNPSLLTVEDETRTYRGRSQIAGFRGIAVGFPGGVSYAFNAKNGTLSGLWLGDFVRVRWDGQGAGDFRPATRAIELPQDIALYRLESATAPWPLMPVINDDQKENLDPLYPRNRGYRFKGYALDAERIPTLFYESGDVKVSDRSVGTSDGEGPVLERELTFDAPAPETVWMRLLTGDVTVPEEGVYRQGRIRIEAKGFEGVVRPQPESDEGTEVLLKLNLPQGISTWSLRYVLRP